MSRKRLLVALTLAVSMPVPAQAAGATYTGKTTQDLPFTLKTRTNGCPS